MRIESMELVRFKRLLVPNIKRIKLSCDSDIQVLVGSNGCGKTSVLNELLPTAPTKTSFPKGGYKTAIYTHNNSTYHLNYSPKDGHMFRKDDVNLNLSGNRNIQLELIKEHIGLDQTMNSILQGSVGIVNLRPSKRQQFFLNINPIDISVFMDTKKKVHKKVVACKNNIAMLSKRQEAISLELLPKEEFDAMCSKLDHLMKDEQNLLVFLTKVTSLLEQVNEADIIGDIDTLIHTARSMFAKVYQFSDYDITRATEHISENNQKITDLKNRIKEDDEIVSSLATEIDGYEKQLELLKSDDGLKQKLISLEKAIAKHRDVIDEDIVYIHKLHLKDGEKIVEAFVNVVMSLNEIDYTSLYTYDDVREMKEAVTEMEHRHHGIIADISTLGIRRDELQSQIKNYKIGTCNTDNCELFITYNSHKQDRENMLNDVNKEIDKLSKSLDKITSELIDKRQELSGGNEVASVIARIEDVIRSQPLLIQITGEGADLHRNLSKSPAKLIERVKQFLRSSIVSAELDDMLSELEILSAKQYAIENMSAVSDNFLRDSLKKTLQKRNIISVSQGDREQQIKRITIENVTLQLLHDSLAKLKYTYTEIDEHIKSQEAVADNEYLTIILDTTASMLLTTRENIAEADKFIKNQTSLLSRLDNEINANIKSIKIGLFTYTHIEHGLHELSHGYTRQFLNSIIDTANSFIEQVINYPFVIDKIPDGNIDFTFPVTINDTVHVNDVSDCSDAQKVIVDLAFSIALIVELEMTDYPLFIDEKDRPLDPVIRDRLHDTLVGLVDQGIVSQMFIINHHVDFLNSQLYPTFVLDSTNLKLAESIAPNGVSIEYY